MYSPNDIKCSTLILTGLCSQKCCLPFDKLKFLSRFFMNSTMQSVTGRLLHVKKVLYIYCIYVVRCYYIKYFTCMYVKLKRQN